MPQKTQHSSQSERIKNILNVSWQWTITKTQFMNSPIISVSGNPPIQGF